MRQALASVKLAPPAVPKQVPPMHTQLAPDKGAALPVSSGSAPSCSTPTNWHIPGKCAASRQVYRVEQDTAVP